MARVPGAPELKAMLAEALAQYRAHPSEYLEGTVTGLMRVLDMEPDQSWCDDTAQERNAAGRAPTLRVRDYLNGTADRHARIFAALGAHHVILPVQEAASETARILSGRPVVHVYRLGEDIAVAVVRGGTGVTVPRLPGIAAVVKAGGSIERAEPGSAVAADTVLLLVTNTQLIGRLTIEGGI